MKHLFLYGKFVLFVLKQTFPIRKTCFGTTFPIRKTCFGTTFPIWKSYFGKICLGSKFCDFSFKTNLFLNNYPSIENLYYIIFFLKTSLSFWIFFRYLIFYVPLVLNFFRVIIAKWTIFNDFVTLISYRMIKNVHIIS